MSAGMLNTGTTYCRKIFMGIPNISRCKNRPNMFITTARPRITKRSSNSRYRNDKEEMVMALTVTPVPRNIATKGTFFYLEFEDLFVILGLAVVMNMLGRFLQREMFGIPMNVLLQYVVPVLSVPALILFKYGKPRGYLQDWLV